MKLKHNLIFELNKLLFNNTTDNQGGEQVRKLFRTFRDDVFKVSRRVASYSLAGKGNMGCLYQLIQRFRMRFPNTAHRM